MNHHTSPSHSVRFQVNPAAQGSRSNWLGYFMTALSLGGFAHADEVRLNYWWVYSDLKPADETRVIRVIGAKGESYEEVYGSHSAPDSALVEHRKQRQARMREEAMKLANELIAAGKSPREAYEDAWTDVYRRYWLNADSWKGSSQLDELLERIARHDDGQSFTEEEIRVAMEALMEDDDRLETEEGRLLLEHLAHRLRAMGVGRDLFAHENNDELMTRFADALRHGKVGASAYRDALFKTHRGSVINHPLIGYSAPWGVGMGRARYWQAPLKVSRTQGSGNTFAIVAPGKPGSAKNPFLATSPDLPEEEEKEEEETTEKKTAQDDTSTGPQPVYMGPMDSGESPRGMRMMAMSRNAVSTVAESSGITDEQLASLISQAGNKAVVVGAGNSASVHTDEKPKSWKDAVWEVGKDKTEWKAAGDAKNSEIKGKDVKGLTMVVLNEGSHLYLGQPTSVDVVVNNANAYLHAELDMDGGKNGREKLPLAGYGLFEFDKLQGKGSITLMGDTAGRTTIYSFTGNPGEEMGFSGLIRMAGSQAARVQLNAAGSHWKYAAVDMDLGSGESYHKKDGSATYSGTAIGTILNITGNAQFLGLQGGDEDFSTVTSNSGDLSYTLTLGDASGKEYIYDGTFNGAYYTSGTASYASAAPLNLTKVYGNTQVMTADATGNSAFNIVSAQGGTLAFSQSLQSAMAEAAGGTLSVGGNLNITETYAEKDELKVAAGGVINVTGDITVADDASVTGGGRLSAANLTVNDKMSVDGGTVTISGVTTAQSLRVFGGGSLSTRNLQDIDNRKLIVEVGSKTTDGNYAASTLTVSGNLEADVLRLRSDGKLVTGTSSNTISESHLHGGAEWVMEGSGNTMYGLMKVENAAGGISFSSNSGSAVLTLPGTISFADAGWTNRDEAVFTLDGVTLDFSRGVTITNLGFAFDETKGNNYFVLADITGKSDGFTSASSSVMVQNGDDVFHANLVVQDSQIVVTMEHVLGQTPFEVADGQVVYVEMYEDASAPALPYKAYTKAGYDAGWSGTSVENEHLLQFSRVNLSGGGALYLGEKEGDAAHRHFGGRLNLDAADKAASVHGQMDAWGNWLLDGRLTGSGTLQLVAHHDIGERGSTTVTTGDADFSAEVITSTTHQYGVASTFTFTDTSSSWMSGTVQLAANAGTSTSAQGGIVQLNIGNVDIAGKGDTRWENVLIDLSSSTYTDPEKVGTTPGVATELVLGVVGDATVSGVKGDANSSIVSDVAASSSRTSPTLTVGNDSQNYTFEGTVGKGNFYTGGQATRVETRTDTYGSSSGDNVLQSSSTTVQETNMQQMGEGRLSLVKVGSNTQSFKGSAWLDSVQVQQGSLELKGQHASMNSLHMSAGTSVVTSNQETHIGSATLDNATLTMSGTAEIDALTLSNGAVLTQTGNMTLGAAALYSGASMSLTGAVTEIDALTLGSDTHLTTGASVTLGSAVLYGGAEWSIGGDVNWSSTPVRLVDMAGQSVNITSAGGSHEWSTMTYLDFAGNSAYSATNPLFQLENGVTLNLGESLTLANVQGLTSNSTIAFIGGVKAAPGLDGKEVLVSDASGNTYAATYKYDKGTVFIEVGLKTDAGILIDPVLGYIWSGENVGHTSAGEDYQGLNMGNVWRADGSGTHTGWHEQRADISVNPGVYVNGETVTFRDTDVHGKEEKHREVYIYGKVAPGKIYVAAQNDLGSMGKGDAELKYGYAFTGHADTPNAGIIDYMDAEGNIITRTSIEKTGDSVLILNTANDFTGGIDVKDGSLYLSRPYSSGTGPIALYVDSKWNDYWDKTGTGSGFATVERYGSELMVNYEHNHDEVSAYRNPVVQNTIILTTGANEQDKNLQATISYAHAAYESKNVDDDFSNVPRHWRNLLITGGLYGEGDLVLRGYTSCWDGGHDQCYISAFSINHSQLDKELIASIYGKDYVLPQYTGTVTLTNAVNASQLSNDNVGARTAGGVQLSLIDDTFKLAQIDLTREQGAKENVQSNGKTYSGYRQSYTNILVVNGNVEVGALSGDFLGQAWKYTRNGSDFTRKFETISQADERWRLRVVTGSETTLRLGRAGDNKTYVYSGMMGFEQSYTQPQQAHISFGNGLETLEDVKKYNGSFEGSGKFSNGTATLSLVKTSQTKQYIHSALLNDVSLYEGTLGFHNLELQGNMNLVGGTHLKLGTYVDTNGDNKDDITGWQNDSTRDQEVVVQPNKTLTVITQQPAEGQELSTAWVEGNITMSSNSTLTFLVNTTPDSLDIAENTGANVGNITPLLDVNGTLSLSSGQAITLSFENTSFQLGEKYYLARADSILVDGSSAVDAFGTRTVTLGYGYFGTLYTVQAEGSSKPGDADTSTAVNDYLVMTVTGDPRRTWSGMVGLTGNDYTWSADSSAMPEFPDEETGKWSDTDYHWKENRSFRNGHVVLFGNLYTPIKWAEDVYLGSDQTVNVEINKQQPGTLVENTKDNPLFVDDFCIDGYDVTGREYQAVKVNGEVAPFIVMINANYNEYTDGVLTQEQQVDDTNYYFYTTEELGGSIRDASWEELERMGFDTSWKTMLHKTGAGTTIMALDNSYTGGSILQGGTMVMQHVNALGGVYKDGALTGQDCSITLMNGAYLQGDFDDADFPGNYHEEGNLAMGKAMATTTINNKVVVNVYVNPDDDSYSSEIDGHLVNSGDKKLILRKLEGESDTVLQLTGVNLSRDEAAKRTIELYAAKDEDSQEYIRDAEGNYYTTSGEILDLDRYNYGVFKVLDPGAFYGTVTMCGHEWGQSVHGGGSVQLDIMSTSKSDDGADWTNATMDLSVKDGTLRTVVALDVMSNGEVCELNSINGTIETEGGSSSVLNMSKHNAATLQLTGTRNGKYEGVLGYGDFQVAVNYGGYSENQQGTTQHHYGAIGEGSLNVVKQGDSTTQEVRRAWLNRLEVQGGKFVVTEALVAHEIASGDGKRVLVGAADPNRAHALAVGAGGILAMNTTFAEEGRKQDAWEELKPGVDGAAFVRLENGATLSAREDWYTIKPIDYASGAAVTVNTRNYAIDPHLRDEYNKGNDVFGKYEHSHIIQLLGDMKGSDVHLTFNNHLIDPDTAKTSEEDSKYMGYAAINDFNVFTGENNTLTVDSMTALQIFKDNAGVEGDMDIRVEGNHATLQILDKVVTYDESGNARLSDSMVQYIEHLSLGANKIDPGIGNNPTLGNNDPLHRENNGQLMLGGTEVTTLAPDSAQYLQSPKMADMQVLISSRHNSTTLEGEVSRLHVDMRGASVKLGGESGHRAEMKNTHVDMARSDVDHVLSHTDLRNTLVHLQEDCKLSIAEAVLVDKQSEIQGVKVEYGADTVNPEIGGLNLDGSVSAGPYVATGNNPTSKVKEVQTSLATTVEMTFVGESHHTYTVGPKDEKILVVQADQLSGVDVTGNGLTLQIHDNTWYTWVQPGTNYLAIQMGGGSGHFLYEVDNATANSSFGSLIGSQFVLQDQDGNPHEHLYWVTSTQVSKETGTTVSPYMLYFALNVPEPATATLSLLALSALCARRRRRA